MASLLETAPELGKYVTEAEAIALADKPTSAPAVPNKTLADLDADELECFVLWLKWFGAPRRPLPQAMDWVDKKDEDGKVVKDANGKAVKEMSIGERKPGQLPWWSLQSPTEVAQRFGFELQYVMDRVAERDGLLKEAARGVDAFTPDPKPPKEEPVPVDGGLGEVEPK